MVLRVIATHRVAASPNGDAVRDMRWDGDDDFAAFIRIIFR